MASSAKESWDTPTIQEDQAGLCIHSTTRIAAPAALVFRTLRNTETWKDWNKFVPRVNITYQPPDDDYTTSAEIEELVRNTSIAGSYDSDLTDGMVGGSQLRQKLSENGETPNTPPLKLRANSQVSRGSTQSGESGGGIAANIVPTMNGPEATAPPVDDTSEPKLSAAQKYAMSQTERKASVASGTPPRPATNNLSPPPAENRGSISRQTPPASPRNSLSAEIDPTGRRKSKTPSLQKAMRARQASLNLLYGEPSVRLQLNTRMTFFCRMNPYHPHDYRQTHLDVREVSRPDDPVTDGSNLTQLTRSKTHTLNRMEVYRIVWGMDHTMSSMSNIKSGSAFPKSLLITERVHEIRPILLGDGSEECELRTWELQKGPMAKVVKKKYGGYLQKQFELWGKGLGEFCEAMTGKVDRRDFSVLPEDTPVGVFTF